jgi:hypothetical protein
LPAAEDVAAIFAILVGAPDVSRTWHR